ncbi:MAG: hypothetical protein KC731_23690 [Myxococcales bacterium]|nr:hypothetical protein [Myxococcales bacterium]
MRPLGALLLAVLAAALTAPACIVGDRPVADNVDCVGGECFCISGYGDCDGAAQNGCESVLDIDPDNCGACGTPCINGRCEDGACSCASGFEDCNGDGRDGCEALLQADPDNCGTCGRSCLGGDCAGSQCEPFLLSDLGTLYIYSMAGDESDVYYCDGATGVIYRVPPAGGESVPLAYDQLCYQMDADGGRAYWRVRVNNADVVRTVSRDGTGLETIAAAKNIFAFKAVGGRLFWSQEGPTLNYALYAGSSLGDGAPVIQSLAPIDIIDVTADRVVWVEGASTIRSLPLTGGMATNIVVTDRFIRGIAAVGDAVYWLETDDDEKAPVILRAPVVGGAAVEVVQRNRVIRDFLADGQHLYWTEDMGDRLLRLPLGGGDVESLTRFQDIATPVLGPDAIYWIDFPSYLFALAK